MDVQAHHTTSAPALMLSPAVNSAALALRITAAAVEPDPASNAFVVRITFDATPSDPPAAPPQPRRALLPLPPAALVRRLQALGLTELEIRLIDLHHRGYSREHIADTLWIASHTVKRRFLAIKRKVSATSMRDLDRLIEEWMQEDDPPLAAPLAAPLVYRPPPPPWAVWREWHEAGQTPEQIAERAHYSVGQVRARLKQMGVKLKRRCRIPRPDTEELRQRYLGRGESTLRMAYDYNVSEGTVKRWLSEANISRRAPRADQAHGQ